jgi:hypothetical protein
MTTILLKGGPKELEAWKNLIFGFHRENGDKL